MLEKETSAENVFGENTKLSEKEKEEFFTVLKEVFDQKKFQEYLPKERAKTAEEVKTIQFVDAITSDLAEKYGGKRLTIPDSNIHIASVDKFDTRAAIYVPTLQAAIIRDPANMTFFAHAITHEMIHFKSYGSFRENAERGYYPYRLGIEVDKKVKKENLTNIDERYFSVVNEAMTEELARYLFNEHNTRSLFAGEEEQTNQYIKTHQEDLNKIIYANTKKEKDLIISHKAEFGYKSERRVLNTLIDKLYERNTGQFQNREEVFDLFARWMFSKSSEGIGKLIDQTFGAGTFRNLARLPLDDERKHNKFLESLG